MTPEQLKEIREWARSGNEPRNQLDVSMAVRVELTKIVAARMSANVPRHCVLNSVGLLIARLADALEQANETAECGQWCLMMDTTGRPHEQLTTMRANRKELLGR